MGGFEQRFALASKMEVRHVRPCAGHPRLHIGKQYVDGRA
jgi:hypothetical protein